MKAKTLTAVALIAAFVPGLSYAQQGDGMRPQPPQIDFASADADSSGGISQQEWTTYVTAQMEARRTEMMGARADALIGAGDTDANGALTRDELITGMTALQEQRRAERGDRGEGRRGHGRDHGRGHDRGDGYGQGAEDGERGGWRGRMGRDHGDHGDRGRGMDPAERAAAAFDRIDDNGDGQIDAQELASLQEHMQRRMERRMGRDSN